MSDALAYGSYHLEFDPELHLAAWGARLIYKEVLNGGNGIVPNRDDGIDAHLLREEPSAEPALERWLELVRRTNLSPSSADVVEYIGDRVLLRGGPQASYGYLYVTAVMLR